MKQRLLFLRAFLFLSLHDVGLHAAAALAALQCWLESFVPMEIGDWCDMCDDVHSDAFKCNRQIVRWCMDCRSFRNLDRWLYCTVDKRHVVHMGMQPTQKLEQYPWQKQHREANG